MNIEPHIGKLTWAKGSVPTAHGPIEVEWQLKGEKFNLLVKVPDGVSGIVKLPDGEELSFQGTGNFQTIL